MGRSRVALVLALLVASTLAPSASQGAERLRLATGTSTVTSGLLDVLIPPFERRYGVRVDVAAVVKPRHEDISSRKGVVRLQRALRVHSSAPCGD